MDNEPVVEKESDLKSENRDLEPTEPQIAQGAEMLENPPEGNFTHGLAAFVAWVKTLFAKNK